MVLNQQIHSIHKQIIDAEIKFGRKRGAVSLIAVSKKRTAADIETFFHEGQHHFGESYLQEALLKMERLKHLPIVWHFIGPIQSNKAKQISQHFDWVQSVASMKVANLLNQHRHGLDPLNICLQINLNNEENKSGFLLEEMPSILNEVVKFKNIKLRGLMTIPQKLDDFDKQKNNFTRLKVVFDSIKEEYSLDTLSMGMSNDFIAAIAAGSTMVRIGTLLFGPR